MDGIRQKPATTLWQHLHINWLPGSYKKYLRLAFEKHPVLPMSVFFFPRLPIYGRAVFKTTACCSKFIILAQGRAGSSLLVDLLNSHPQMHCDSEILRYRIPFLKMFLNGRSKINSHKTYGFKLKLNHLIDAQKITQPEIFLRDLQQAGWKIIYLERKNQLRRIISWYVAKERGDAEYRIDQGPLKLQQVVVDSNRLVQDLEQKEAASNMEKEVLKDIPHLKICYEEDLLNEALHQTTLNRIFDFLNLDAVPVGTELQKICADSLNHIIANYDEMAQVIGQTKYAHFLTDEVSPVQRHPQNTKCT